MVIQLVLATLLGLHLLSANVATGGPFICLWLQRRDGRNGNPQAAALNRSLIAWSLGGLVLAAVTGLLMMAIVARSYPHVFEQTVPLIRPGRYYASLGELAFSMVLYGGYYALSAGGFASASAGRRVLGGALLLISGLNTAYHFPALFAILGVNSMRPEVWGTELRIVTAILDPEVAALACHFLLASVAVTGLLVSSLAARNEPGPHASLNPYARSGGWIALIASALQLVVGLWLLMATAEGPRRLLMGGSWHATALFAMAVVSALMLMHRLASLALGREKPDAIKRCWVSLIATVWLMCCVQQVMRHAVYEQLELREAAAAAPLLPQAQDD